jgi:membrane-bound lytic murein transglycosylase D
MQNPMRLGQWPGKTFNLPVVGCVLLSLVLSGCTPTDQKSASVAPEATAPALPAVAPQQSAPAPNPHESRHVRQLIQQVEQAYALGEADYRKGRLADAKAEFDRAVDLMLLSGIDIKADPSLQEEFDHILDKVNALETEALKRGNGFVPQQEETPAEAAAEVTFKVDPNLVAKAQADLATTKSDLPLVVNDYVAAFINFFANTKRGHNTLLYSLQRAGRYRAMIQRVMAEEGVPQDLIYLAVAESGFNPRALNRKSGAGGMWQFMPNDKFYGLAKTAYVDERFDPEKSTRAYARYMKFIYNQLGDWYLSMASYNWGTRNVQRAVQKTGYADFWELYKRNNLPVDTKSYVPEIIASIIIANHPAEYGFDEIASDPPVLTDTVTINYAIDLRLVSDIVGASVEEMAALNPSLLRRITPPDSSFDLHLPAGTGGLFERRVAAVPVARRIAWRYHRVASGETLASIAHERHVGVEDLAAANQLAADSDLTNVEGLAIPSSAAVALPSSSASTASKSSASSAPSVAEHAQSYKVRKGDTLVTIADRYGVSLSQLRQWNHLKGASTKIAAGRRLQVSDAATAPVRRGARTSKRGASDEAAPEATTKNCAPAKGKKRKGRHAAPCVATSAVSSDDRETSRESRRSKHGAAAQEDAKTAETKSTARSAKSASRSEKSAARSASKVESTRKTSSKKEKAEPVKKAQSEPASSSGRRHSRRK